MFTLLVIIYRYTTNGHHDNEEEGEKDSKRRTRRGQRLETQMHLEPQVCLLLFFGSTWNHLQLDYVTCMEREWEPRQRAATSNGHQHH